MKKFIKSKKFWLIALVVGIFLIYMVNSYNAMKKQEELDKKLAEQEEMAKQLEDENKDEYSDSLIMQMQDKLIKDYGKLPKGYIWDMDGSLLSLGDKKLSAEEVVYAYLNGLQSLDMSMVQKYSRGSQVVKHYESYFSTDSKNADYTDQFKRKMYREALLSLQVEGIVNSTVFAEDKQVFTVKVNMLDLTSKDFWQDDKLEIYKNLKVYGSEQADTTKRDMYLYDYILGYYTSDHAKMRETTFDLTVQRYPDLDTGWLVSVDNDIDIACRYASGKLVVSYIVEQYYDEGVDLLKSLEEAGSGEGIGEEIEDTEGLESEEPLEDDLNVGYSNSNTDETVNQDDIDNRVFDKDLGYFVPKE